MMEDVSGKDGDACSAQAVVTRPTCLGHRGPSGMWQERETGEMAHGHMEPSA